MSGLASAVRGRSADQTPRRPSGASERQGRDAGAGPGRIPSDSRHLLGLGQALLRRGKQMSGRTHGEPRATRVTHGVATGPQTPALLWCRCSGHGGLRSSATATDFCPPLFSLLMAGPCLDFGCCMGSSTPPFIGSLSFVIPLLPQRWVAGGVVNSSLVGANGGYPQARKRSKRFIDSKEIQEFQGRITV